MTFAGEILRFPLAPGLRLVQHPQTFPLRANKQTDAPGADFNSCRASFRPDSQTSRNAHPCGARREVPRKRGGSLSELGLRRSWREGIPNRRRPPDPLRRLESKGESGSRRSSPAASATVSLRLGRGVPATALSCGALRDLGFRGRFGISRRATCLRRPLLPGWTSFSSVGISTR